MRKLLCVLLCFVMSVSLTSTAFASGIEPTVEMDNYLDMVEAEMSTFIQETDLPMTVENFTVTLRTDIDFSEFSDAEISQLIEEDIANMQRIMSESYYDLSVGIIIQPRLSNNGGGEYTAEVWAGVPSVGWCTVKQDFKATISGGKVTSISFLGDGYMTGVSWGSYNHIRSWYELYSNNTKVDINIKGNINYLFNMVNANYTATFLEELEVSGTSLVRQW